ncbi:hypothetical protein [Virgisporangium aurantiacum]|uniref:Uncharacterized protein n=1 Tax=Virgisporangium aurantiacum TaxID=175570 RepID=A0A8J3YW62_9ACTN|nr:hypothetical protein [Virgisporangium aurantiacum]GIJ52784.1 hypothetical protein Vau01_003000 [Virgisporangium aurantiacum]
MITDEERRVGNLLRAVEAPRSNADVAGAVVRGRKRRRRRGVAAVAAATVVTVAMGLGTVAVRRTLTGPEPAATAACQVATLPNLPNRNLKVVLDLDPSGRYVIGKYHRNRGPASEGEAGIVRWDGTAGPVDLGVDFEDGEEVATALPDGTVLASSKRLPFGVRLRTGERAETAPRLLGFIGLGWIGPDGRVAGWKQERTFQARYAAAVWSSTPEVGKRYPRPYFPDDEAESVPDFKPLAIGATGVTVGIRWDPDRYVVRFPEGQERTLALPDGLMTHDAAQVTGDWAVGTAMERGHPEVVGINVWGATSGPVAVRFNLATGAVDRIAGADGTVVPGVSANGTVAYADADGRAALGLPNGKVARLPMPPGRQVVDRLQLSDDGRTVVGALRVPGTTDVIEAVRWTC